MSECARLDLSAFSRWFLDFGRRVSDNRARLRMLRPHESCARAHTVTGTPWSSRASLFLLAFACVLLVAIAAPAAPAAPADPKQAAPPQELWNAFPLNPKGERLVPERPQAGPKAPFTPPAKPQAVAETPSETSTGDVPVLALVGGAGAFVLLALLGFAAVRLRHGAVNPRRSVPLWQGTAGIESSPVARLQHYADVDVSLTQPSRFGTGDVESRSGARDHRPRSPSPRDLGAVAQLVRDAIWNENTAPVIVGSAIAIVTALLVIYMVG